MKAAYFGNTSPLKFNEIYTIRVSYDMDTDYVNVQIHLEDGFTIRKIYNSMKDFDAEWEVYNTV